MTKLLGGADEAGRGPVIGPIVMAGVTVKPGVQEKLKEIGVKDSKLLTPARRNELFDVVKEMVESYEIIVDNAEDVDAALNDPAMNLNLLEAKSSAIIMDRLKPDTMILDCPSINPPAYVKQVQSFLKTDKDKIEIIAEHKADMNYPVVAAASILAKVTRDRLIQELQSEAEKILGEKVNIGSGYPADPYTKAFLAKYWDKLDNVKGGFFRKTWKTYKNIVDSKSQKGLASF